LVEEAVRLGHSAIGITDRNSLAGVVRAHVAIKETGLRLAVGARLDTRDGYSLLVYPRHLAGRVFAVVVHGDSAGVETLRRILGDWLSDIGRLSAGHKAEMGAYIGYYEPYASSHDALDRDGGFQEEVRNAARSLVRGVKLMRRDALRPADAGLRDPRTK
jgi:hypothetical protein